MHNKLKYIDVIVPLSVEGVFQYSVNTDLIIQHQILTDNQSSKIKQNQIDCALNLKNLVYKNKQRKQLTH